MSEVQLAELISKIAHELRSPLTSVKGFSSMLITRWDRFTDEQRFQLVETIAADADRMARIVSEVLDLARMEAGRLELNITEVPARVVVDRALARTKELPGAERVEVSIPGDLVVLGDVDRLEAIVANLLENAIKFSDEGPIEIAGSGSGATASISVRDRGIGIPPDGLEHVFSGTRPPGEGAVPTGTGLGLYLTRGLVELHGGSISVASKLGEGSTFTVSLPGASDGNG
jgi:signal transduction histidine kinase